VIQFLVSVKQMFRGGSCFLSPAVVGRREFFSHLSATQLQDSDLLEIILTGDEIWIFQCDAETKH